MFAEDLLVHKGFAGREKDWLDVEGIVLRQRSRLDIGLVEAELHPLLDLKGTPRLAPGCATCWSVSQVRLPT